MPAEGAQMTKVQRTREARPELTQFMRSIWRNNVSRLLCNRRFDVSILFVWVNSETKETTGRFLTAWNSISRDYRFPPAATSRIDATRHERRKRDLQKNPKSLSRVRTHRDARDVEGDPTARSNESLNVSFILKIERVRARGRFRLFGGITHRDDARSRSGILRHRSSRSVASVRSLVDARREVTTTHSTHEPIFARTSPLHPPAHTLES